jgi:microcystin-dependent protein
VTNTVANRVPTGVITLWFGSIVSVPSGWALCDGGNGTPDLRNRFIVGAGSTYAVNAVGGSANAIVVDHTHLATSVVSDPSHTHVNGSFTELLATNGTGTVTTTNSTPGEPQVTASANLLANTTGITVATTVANAGVSALNANLPPYYALAYIMKL